MAIETVASVIEYLCDTATVIFPIDFDFLDEDNILVKLYDSSTQQLLTLDLTTDYTIANSEVTTVLTYPIGDIIYIALAMTFTQETDLQENGQISSDLLDLVHDKLTLIAQELNISRAGTLSLELPEEDANLDIPPVALRKSRILAFDANGDVDVRTFADLGAYEVTPWAETLLDDANAAEGRTTLEVYSEAETDAEVSDLAGAGRIAETVKANADAIAANTVSRQEYMHRFSDIWSDTLFTWVFDSTANNYPAPTAWQNGSDAINLRPLYVNKTAVETNLDGGGWWFAYPIPGQGIYVRGANNQSVELFPTRISGDCPRAFHFSDNGQYGALYIFLAAGNDVYHTSAWGEPGTWTRTATTGHTGSIQYQKIVWRNGYFYVLPRTTGTDKVHYAPQATPYALTEIATSPAIASNSQLVRLNDEVFCLTVTTLSSVSVSRLDTDTTFASIGTIAITDAGNIGFITHIGAYVPTGADAGYYFSCGSDVATRLVKVNTAMDTVTEQASPINSDGTMNMRDPLTGIGVYASKYDTGITDLATTRNSEPIIARQHLDKWRQSLYYGVGSDGEILAFDTSRDTDGNRTFDSVIMQNISDHEYPAPTTEHFVIKATTGKAYLALKHGDISVDLLDE